MAEIKSVSIRHNEIMDFLMMNPRIKLGDVAAHFGITQPWLSQVIHSDAFQALLKNKQEIGFHDTVLPIKEKMLNVAHIALDQLASELPRETDARNLSAIAGDVLERLGFGSKAPAVQINNTQNVQVNTLRSELDEARALLGKAARPALEVSIDGSVPYNLALPDQSAANLGQTDQREFLALPANGGN